MSGMPLSRVRVLDLTLIWAGPHAVMMLGDLGAEIVRIESTQHHITNTRGFVPRPSRETVQNLGYLGSLYADLDPKEAPWNRHAMFNSLGRNKYSMTVDLTKPEGRRIVHDLVKVSDVLVENQSVGLLRRFELDYETVRALNPTLVYLTLPVYGLSGPYADYMGFGTNGEAMAGVLSLRGYRNSDSTTAGIGNHMDATSGVAAAYAAMLGLMQRDQTGEGRLIEFAQVEHLIQQIGGPLMDAVMNNRAQTPLGNRDPVRAPQGVYRCKDEDRSDDRWIALTVGADDEWTGLCTAIGRPELALDPRFEDMFVRSANHDELDEIIEEWSRGQEARLAAEILQRHGVPAGMVAQDFDVLEDPHLDARGFFHQIDHPEVGRHRYPGHTYRLSKTPLRFDSPPPLLGEQNDYVYRDLLGFGEAHIQRLTEAGHIGTAYADHVR